MTLEYYDEAKAERLFEQTFIKWLAYGYKGCFSPLETARGIGDTRAWAWRSKTARDLMNAVVSSEKKIIVVGMRGGFQCFNSTEGPDANLPVVFVDLDGKLTVNVRTPHNFDWDPNQCTGDVVPLNNRIALLHEFGHSKQWVDRPLMFDNQKGKGGVMDIQVSDGKGGTVNKKVKSGVHDFDARLEKGKFGSAIKDRARDVWAKKNLADTSFLLSDEQAKEFKTPAWGVQIEEDNMSRHEWPICLELGLPVRKNYRDINVTSTGAPSTTSIIALKARDFEAKEAAKLAARQQEMASLKSTQKVGCPQCTKTFPSEKARDFHIKFEHKVTD